MTFKGVLRHALSNKSTSIYGKYIISVLWVTHRWSCTRSLRLIRSAEIREDSPMTLPQ